VAASPVAAVWCEATATDSLQAAGFVCFLFPERPRFGLRVDDQALALGAADPPLAVVINPGQAFQADKGGPAAPFYLARLESEYLGSLAEELYELPSLSFPEPLRSIPAQLVEDARRLAVESLGATSESRLMAGSLSTVFAVDLLHALLPEGELMRTASRCHPGVREARRLMRTHYRSAIGVKDLAAQAGLGTSQFIAVFKRDMGLTPHEYLRRVRIAEAKRLLRAGCEVSSTCRAVGFSSLGGFGGAFSAIVGMSPQRFRSLAGARGDRGRGK
jgi:AraC-like DNA-binding protein